MSNLFEASDINTAPERLRELASKLATDVNRLIRVVALKKLQLIGAV